MIFGKGFQMSSNVPHYKIGIDKNRERNVQSWGQRTRLDQLQDVLNALPRPHQGQEFLLNGMPQAACAATPRE